MSTTFKFGAGKWAAKAGSVLAYNDLNNNFKPLPFTFTRASSATRVNESGLIEIVASGVPRIDYLDNADGHLLLEPSRTNLFSYSNDFSNAAWTKSAVTMTSASSISPDGTNNAWKIQGDGTSTTVRVYETETLTANTTHYLSVFAKKGTNNYLRFLFSSFDGSSSAGYDLNAGTATGNNASIVDYGNGWYKCILFANITSPDVSGTINIYLTKSDTVTAFDDNTEAANAYAYIYGAQLEAGSYATSYIPTSGSAVTRAADNASQTPPSGVIGQTEGTLFVKFNADGLSTAARAIVYITQDSTTANRIAMQYTAGGQVQAIASRAGVTQGSVVHTITGLCKAAFAYSASGYELFINGSSIGTFSGSLPVSLLKIDLGNITSLATMGGSLSQVQLYNTRLSSSQLKSLTS